jgi:hypothetical protein
MIGKRFKLNVSEVIHNTESHEYGYIKIEALLEQALEEYLDRIPLSCRYEGVTSEELRAGLSPTYWEIGRIPMFELFFTFEHGENTAPCKILTSVRNKIQSRFNKVYLGDPKIATTVEGKLAILDIKMEFFGDDTWSISHVIIQVAFEC